MPLLAALPLYSAVAAYLAASALAFAYVRGSDARYLGFGKRLAGIANMLLFLVFLARWHEYRLLPLTGISDSLNLFLIFATGIMVTVQRGEGMSPLLSFYLPALGLIALVSGAIAPAFANVPPRELHGAPLTIHVGLVTFGFALFFVASLTSVVYVFKARHLKQRKSTGLFHRIPSLERLDQILMRLMGMGYQFFGAALIFGFIWALADRESVQPHWYISSHVVFALVVVLFFAALFHLRRFGLLRGTKLAYLVIGGFLFVLTTYITFGVLRASDYSFFEAAL
ncbi:MAG: cytochrome c biogenesis protein CcsA [Candidatus Hydrogenedentes bacterium]|jgi:ABC-type transport system involved in cytochrome c biogenesis permease subunit|nr:cytochrome c biogenesis protein CcsA [Candidatus Hydrogenedentota bacterium]